MKNRIIILLCAVLMSAVCAKAQVYDGITQPNTYRIWLTASQPQSGGEATFSSFVGYKYNIAKWVNVTGIANYNFSAKAFSPAVWVNFNICDWVYILSRNIYDAKANKYKQTLSATVKIPHGFMIDATWDNAFNGDKWCDGDRMQVLGGYGYKRFVVNAGYSMRAHPGFIANVRFKFTPGLWAQAKYDGGLKTYSLSVAYNFN